MICVLLVKFVRGQSAGGLVGSQMNDFLRSILFLASMEIAKHDLYISAPVFLVPPMEISRYSAWKTHLKF